MTQQDLAGSDFSKGFISLVETGRTRVSLRAAGILAQRLGVSVTDLMTPEREPSDLRVEIEVLEADAQLQAGHADKAIAQLDGIQVQLSGKLAARAHRTRGLALLATDRAADAIQALERARTVFAAVGDRELAIRTTFDLARAHGRADNHGPSLALALESERALERGEVVDSALMLEVLAYLASKFVTFGDARSAEHYGDRARLLVADVADPRRAAHLYLSLAVTRREHGDLEGALEYARKSITTYEQLGDQRQLGSSYNTLGWVYVQRGAYGRGAEALEHAGRIANDIGDRRLLAYVLQTQAELELARGKASEAVRLAEASIEIREASARCRALSQLVRAQALAKSKAATTVVRRAFEGAFAALEPEGSALLARAHEAFFEVLYQRREFREASEAAGRALELLRPHAS